MIHDRLLPLSESFNFMNEISEQGDFERRGKLFATQSHNYFYDTGTGKVICLDDISFQIMKNWIEGNTPAIESLITKGDIFVDSAIELLNTITEENLLKAKKPIKLYAPSHYETLEEDVRTKREQLIFELTGKCNLRCGYCVYNDEYVHARAFNSEDLSFDTAQKAIDDFYLHSGEEIAITFYGGEPLIRFDLLKKIIEYSLAVNEQYKKLLSFSITTNATLVTDEIAQYLASIESLNLLCSIDGPEEIHDAYRLDVDQNGSFARAIAGTEKLSKSFSKQGRKIAINAVFAPPYTYEKLDYIEKFFNGLDFLPENVNIGFSYPSEGSITGETYRELIIDNSKYKNALFEDVNPLWEWRKNKLNESQVLKFSYPTIVTTDIEKEFAFIDNRIVTHEPNDIFPINGCCVPGKRRLYVDTKGIYYPCERIGNCPDIGNVEQGLDLEKIKKYYIDEYVEKSIEKCSTCWAVKMCTLCYANRYSAEGFVGSNYACEGTKSMLVRTLSHYHELREGSPERIAHFSETILA